jgi:hypothetical protein
MKSEDAIARIPIAMIELRTAFALSHASNWRGFSDRSPDALCHDPPQIQGLAAAQNLVLTVYGL